MSQQLPSDPNQRLNIDNASIKNSQIGQAGRDLAQIQGGVVNVTVFDKIDVSGWLGKEDSGTSKPLTQQDYRNRKVLLNKVKNFWIGGVLEKSLHTKALIELGFEERLNVVERPFSNVQESPDEPRQALPIGTDITQVFNQMGEGKTLLILGEPGAGKTTILLKILQDLIVRIGENLSQPIPVVFNLSSWASKQQTIGDWLVQELQSQYQVSKKLGKAWVEEQQLLLLLDGLDEVKAERRESCVRAINQFIQAHGQTEIVICSRIKDYEVLSTRLQLQGAIYIQSLTLEQINQYLEQAGNQLEAVKTLLQEDPVLQELAKTPLMLSVMSLAYQGISVEALTQRGSINERRHHLFTKYVERMFKLRGVDLRYPKAKVIRYLIWLAQSMTQESQTVFLIENIQPNYLKTNKYRKIYTFCVALTFGLIFSPVGVLFSIGTFDILEKVFERTELPKLYFMLIPALSVNALILLIGIFIGLEDQIKTVEKLRWSWGRVRSFFRTIDKEGNGQLIWLLPFFILIGFESFDIEEKTAPNEGIQRSIRNAATSLAIVSMPYIVVAIGLVRLALQLKNPGLQLFFGLMIFVIGAVNSLRLNGVSICFQHLILRLILYCNGFIPWNYARFLNYATERIFLQKVGGGYIFIHRMLREHFAQMELDQVKR